MIGLFIYQYFYQEVQQTVAEKTSALESEAFKTKRMQEETAILKRKVRMLYDFSNFLPYF